MTEPGPITLAYLAAHPLDAARAMETLDPAELAAFIETVPVRLAAPPLAAIAPWRAARCLATLAPDRAAALLEEMPGDRRTPCVRALAEQPREAIIGHMSPRRARALRRQLGYPAALVGAAMAADMITVREEASTGEALAAARAPEEIDVLQLYLVDAKGRPEGVVPLAVLLDAAAERPVRELARRDCEPILADRPLAHVATDRDWSRYAERPVVDTRQRLVGTLTLGRVLEARERAAGAVTSGAGPAAMLTQGYLVSVGGLARLAGAMLFGTTGGRHER